jgi:rhodanese-related sulfurtransferase
MSTTPAFVSPAELHTLLAASPQLALLDVRTPAEFAEVHLPSARSEPLARLQPDALLASGAVSRDQPVYFVCRTDNRAKIAAEKFAAAGHHHVVVVTGGTLAWIDAGLPVLRGAVKVISLERQVRIAAGSLVLLGAVLGWFVHRGFYGLSAFVGAGLVFAGITDFCGLGLLLARLPWNQRSA